MYLKSINSILMNYRYAMCPNLIPCIEHFFFPIRIHIFLSYLHHIIYRVANLILCLL